MATAPRRGKRRAAEPAPRSSGCGGIPEREPNDPIQFPSIGRDLGPGDPRPPGAPGPPQRRRARRHPAAGDPRAPGGARAAQRLDGRGRHGGAPGRRGQHPRPLRVRRAGRAGPHDGLAPGHGAPGRPLRRHPGRGRAARLRQAAARRRRAPALRARGRRLQRRGGPCASAPGSSAAPRSSASPASRTWSASTTTASPWPRRCATSGSTRRPCRAPRAAPRSCTASSRSTSSRGRCWRPRACRSASSPTSPTAPT